VNIFDKPIEPTWKEQHFQDNMPSLPISDQFWPTCPDGYVLGGPNGLSSGWTENGQTRKTTAKCYSISGSF